MNGVFRYRENKVIPLFFAFSLGKIRIIVFCVNICNDCAINVLK